MTPSHVQTPFSYPERHAHAEFYPSQRRPAHSMLESSGMRALPRDSSYSDAGGCVDSLLAAGLRPECMTGDCVMWLVGFVSPSWRSADVLVLQT